MTRIIGEFLLGWLLADLLTGIFHWWEDRFGREEWPIIGPWIIAPNRLHHLKPLEFIKGGFWGRNRANLVTTAVLGSGLLALTGPSVWLLALAIGGGFTNEVHRYAHQPSAAPTWVRLLQQTGFLQSPKGHAAHHRPPQDAQFCVLTDWLNPFLEHARVWKFLERVGGRHEGT